MVLPYRRYFDFAGRSRRREYWGFALFYGLVLILLVVLLGDRTQLASTTSYAISSSIGGVIASLFILASIVPGLAVTIRRLHDQDRSGWLVMLFLGPYLALLVFGTFVAMIPLFGAILLGGALAIFALVQFVGGFVLLVLMCLGGTRGPNRFGPDPKDPSIAGVFS